jgi:hypothetical protein
MYSSGPGQNGLIVGQSGGSFLSGIPWWAYVIVILIGLGLSVFCFVQYSAARRRAAMMAVPIPGSPPPLPGAPPPLAGSPPPGAGNGFLIGGIVSALLLVLAPLVVMLVMQPWGSNWIVGRWSARPGCAGESVEFTSEGILLADGHSMPYRVDGDQVTVNGRTQTVRHDGDRLTTDNETFYRCTGSGGATAMGTPAPSPSPYAPSPMPSAPAPAPTYGASSVPVPDYANWVIGRWSATSDCVRAMEFRADGTATNSSGEPATFTVTPNGTGVGIVIQGSSQRIAGYMDPEGPSAAILRAYQPSSVTLNLRRC